MSNLAIPHFQIRANGVVVYWLPINHRGKRFDLEHPAKVTYSGKVTGHVKRRLMSSLDLMLQRSYQKVANMSNLSQADFEDRPEIFMNFITLTIASQTNMEVRECYDKLLKPFLRYMKRKEGMDEYVWKAEYQKRGQVHYHLATNIYIDWQKIRWYWNKLQRKERLLDKFAKKFGHFNPNSTDIHTMRKVTDALAYMSKEMCKDVQNTKVTKGKVWDCSNNLKGGRFNSELKEVNEWNLDDAIQNGFGRKIEGDRFVIVKMANPTGILTNLQEAEYVRHLDL